jgi:hypothetical protein
VTFLAPIPAIIAASIALPALLTFYFLRLRRRPVRVSSTLLWMQATNDLQVNVPLRMIRPSWLLLLQLLILASLLVALARPAVHMESAPVGRAVILIDRSASMAARDGAGGEPGQTRLDEAKRRALVVADRLGRSGGTLVSVVAYGADARSLTPFTADRGAVREAIRSIQVSDQPDNLGAALDLVSASAMGERGDASDEGIAPERMLVVLVSDGGTPAPPGLSLDNADWRFEGVGPLPGGPPALDNLGIAAISARRDYQDPATVRLFARVVNAGPEAVATVLTLSVDGAVVDRRPLEVPASSGPAPAQVGEASASFEFQNSGGGVVVASLGRPDALGADNAGAIVLSEPSRPGGLLVTPTGGVGVEGAARTWLIGDVLAELDLRPFRTVGVGEYERLASEGGLGPYALVVFDRVRPLRLPPVASISFGAGLPAPAAPPGAGSPAGSPAGEDDADTGTGSTRFLSWERGHAVLRDVALDSVVIARSIDTLRAIDLGGDSKRVLTELARGENGPLIELVEDGPVRRIVVGFDVAQSNWPLSVGFAIFLSNAVDFLTLRGEAEAGRAFTTIEPVRLRVGADAGRDLSLQGPDGSLRAAREPGASVATVGVLGRAGLYTVEGAGQGGDHAVAVNLVNQTESAIRTSRELTIAGRAVASASGGAGPREVWPWFVLAAAVLLAGEWFLHALMMKV